MSNGKSVYELRKAGIEVCTTQGSNHYKTSDQIEPLELTAAIGALEGFALGSIIKYAARYTETKNQSDLAKIADYAHILAGYNREV